MLQIYTVLYVDDEPGLLEIGKLYIERDEEFQVRTLPLSREAIGLLKSERFDAVISDYQMPEIDGLELLKMVRKEIGDIPFILFTGRGREEVVIEAINNGVDFYLQKGGDPKSQFAELTHKIKRAVARYRDQYELRAAYEQIAAAEEELRQQYDELKRNQDVIIESEKRFRDMADLLPLGVYEADSKANLTYINQKGMKIWNFPPDILESGFSCIDSVVPEDRKRVAEVVSKMFEKGYREDSSVEYTALRTDGSTLPITIYSSLITRDGKFTGMRGVIVDITEQKKAEAASALASRKLAMMFDISRHIIRNKMTALLGCAEMVAGEELPEKRHGIIQDLKDQAQALHAEIEFMQDYEKVGVTRPEWQNLRPLIPTPGPLEIVIASDLDAFEIYADPLISRAFAVLVDNVKRHGKYATKIEVRARKEGNSLSITFQDNGA